MTTSERKKRMAELDKELENEGVKITSSSKSNNNSSSKSKEERMAELDKELENEGVKINKTTTAKASTHGGSGGTFGTTTKKADKTNAKTNNTNATTNKRAGITSESNTGTIKGATRTSTNNSNPLTKYGTPRSTQNSDADLLKELASEKAKTSSGTKSAKNALENISNKKTATTTKSGVKSSVNMKEDTEDKQGLKIKGNKKTYTTAKLPEIGSDEWERGKNETRREFATGKKKATQSIEGDKWRVEQSAEKYKTDENASTLSRLSQLNRTEFNELKNTLPQNTLSYKERKQQEEVQNKFNNLSDGEKDLLNQITGSSNNGVNYLINALPNSVAETIENLFAFGGSYAQKEQIKQQLKEQYGWTDADILTMQVMARRNKNKQKAEPMQQIVSDNSGGKGWIAEAIVKAPGAVYGAIPSMVGKAFNTVDNLQMESKGGVTLGFDENSMLNTGVQTSDTMRNAALEKHSDDDNFAFWYGVVESTANSFAAAIPGATANIVSQAGGGQPLEMAQKIGAYSLYGSAANERAADLSEQGAKLPTIIANAAIAYAAEYVGEQLPLENLTDKVSNKFVKDTLVSKAGEFATRLISQSAAEVPGEVLTDLINEGTDRLINGELSENSQRIANYQSQGYSYEDARKQSNKDFLRQLGDTAASAFVMGALSGGLSSSVGGTIRAGVDVYNKTSGAKLQGKQANQQGQTSAIIKAAQATPANSTANKLASKYQNKAVKSGTDLTNRQIGRLEQETTKALQSDKLAENQKQNILGVYSDEIQKREQKEKLKANISNANKIDIINAEIDVNGKTERIKGNNSVEDGTVSDGNIFKGKAGNLTVETSTGKTLTVDNDFVSKIKDNDIKTLYQHIVNKKMSPESANLLLNTYDGEEVSSEHAKAFERIKQQGELGTHADVIKTTYSTDYSFFTADQIQKITALGLKEKQTRIGVTNWTTEKLGAVKKFQLKVLQLGASNANQEVIVVDNLAEEITDSNGNKSLRYLNGQQLRGTNKILISANADGGLLLSFFGHEQGHSIKENAPAMFDELTALTKKLYQTGNKDYDKELERLVKLGYTEADAQEEIVCNSLYKVYNKGFIQKLIEKFPQQANGLKKSIDSMLKMYDTAAKMLGRANMDILGQDNTRTVLAEIQATYEKAMDIVGEKNKARVEQQANIETKQETKAEQSISERNNIDRFYSEVVRENQFYKFVQAELDDVYSTVRENDISTKDIAKIAKDLIYNYNSKMDLNTLIDKLTVFYDFRTNSADNFYNDYDGVQYLTSLATELIDSSDDILILNDMYSVSNAALEIQKRGADVAILKDQKSKYKDLAFNLKRDYEALKKDLYKEAKLSADERVAKYKERRKKTAERQIQRAKLNKNWRYLNLRLNNESNTRHIPENYKGVVDSLLKAIPTGSERFNASNLDKLALRYSEIVSQNENLLGDESREQIGSVISSYINDIKVETTGSEAPDSRMRDLSDVSLDKLNQITQHIKYMVDTENKLFDNQKRGSLEIVANDVASELAETIRNDNISKDVGGKGIKQKVIKTAADFRTGLTKPEYLMKNVGSETLYDMYKEIRRGENKEAEMLTGARDKLQSIKTKNKYDPTWTDKPFKWKTQAGEIDITIEEAMTVYALSKRQQARGHLLSGGISVLSQEKGKRATREIHSITEGDLVKLSSQLTSEQKAYADNVISYMSTEIAESRNDVSMRLYGIERYKEQNYFPIQVDKTVIDTNLSRPDYASAIANQESSKRTTKGAKNAIMINGFTDVAVKHIYDSALYCAYSVPLENFKKVFNYKGYSQENSAIGVESKGTNIHDDLRTVLGNNGLQQFKNLIRDIDSGQRESGLMSLTQKFFGKAKKAAIMGNVSVVVQQPTAVFRAMLYLNPKYFVNIATKSDIQEMYKYNGCAVKKQIGYFDVNIGSSATDYINEYNPSKEITNEWTRAERLQQANISEKLDNALSIGANKADEITWGAIWNACKRQVTEQQNLQGEKMLQKAAELFQDTIQYTQVYDSVFTKPQFMRTKEFSHMLATNFMSEPLTSLNMLADSAFNFNKEKTTETRRKMERAFACYAVSLVVNAACKSIVYAVRDDDDDYSFWEKYLGNIVGSITGDVFGLVPYVSDVINVLEGWDIQRMDTQFLSAIYNAYQAWASEDKDLEKILKSTLQGIGYATGVPAYNLYRDIKSVITQGVKIKEGIEYKLTDGKSGKELVPTTARGLRESVVGNLPLAKTASNYERLYEDILNGDTADYNKVYQILVNASSSDTPEKTINAGIAKALAEHDDRIATAYQYALQGKDSSKEQVISELKEQGFDEATINSALKKYQNARIKEIQADERIEQAKEARENGDNSTYKSLVKEIASEGNYTENEVLKAVNDSLAGTSGTNSEFEIEDETYYDKAHDVRNAMQNGDEVDVKNVYKEMLKQGTEEKEAKSAVVSEAKTAYKNGEIEYEQAQKYVFEYGGQDSLETFAKSCYKDGKIFDDELHDALVDYERTEDDIYWEMEKAKYDKEHKDDDDAPNYSKYTDYATALESGENIYSTIDRYLEHGVSAQSLYNGSAGDIKVKVQNGDIDPATLIDAYVYLGYSYSKASKKVYDWLE